MPESLLEKYPHLKLLTKLSKARLSAEDGSRDAAPRPRPSLLGPGPAVGVRQAVSPPSVTLKPPVKASTGRVYAEDLFAASVAADDDQWICFEVISYANCMHRDEYFPII